MPEFVTEGTGAEFQCEVSSIYPGKSATNFTLKVGSESFTAGVEADILESNGMTFTVLYTYVGEFNKTHHDQTVLCEVTWQDNTPVKRVVTSTAEKLEVYCKQFSMIEAISVDLKIHRNVKYKSLLIN